MTSTFANDDALPKVPLPTVEESADRFLEWSGPLLDDGQRAETEAAVRDLLAPESPVWTLQADLERFDGGAYSWLDEFWPRRYLGRRDRIAVNANFFFEFHRADTADGSDQPTRAADLTVRALAHKRALDDETFPPLAPRDVAQSMDQSKHLFSTTRIPGDPQDSVRTPYTDEWPGPSTERHVLVFSRGRMYRMDVIGADGAPHTVAEIADGMRSVLDAASDRAPVEDSVGSLTTMARAEWAAVRATLREHNAETVDMVERALFCVYLDDVGSGGNVTDDHEGCRHLLAGDSGNRWFDKAVSFVVLADGRSGINVEHCELDGTTILTLVDDMFDGSLDDHASRIGVRSQGAPAVTPVEWVLDDALRGHIASAAQAFDEYLAATATRPITFDDFGADDAKALKSSPDAFVQMAYQVAHRRAKGLTGATYESIATRQFRRGRTEAMRVVTPEILAFVDAMEDPSVSDDAKRDAFRAAASAHGARAKECQQGLAPEQHLWELQLIQERRGSELGATEPMPLFDSPGWTIMRSDYLSTSSAPSSNIRNFGFGSTSPQCIGVAYVLLPDRLHVHLSTPESVADKMDAFADELRRAIAELRELLAED